MERVYDANTTVAPKADARGAELSVVSAAHIQACELGQAQIDPGMRSAMSGAPCSVDRVESMWCGRSGAAGVM